MKKLILLLWVVLLNTAAFSQTRNLNLREFNTWSLQANGAVNYGNTDIVQNSLFYTGMAVDAGYGLRLNRFISHNFALSLDGYRSTLHGSNPHRSYKTSIDYQVAVIGQIQTGNIRFINQFSKMQLYSFLGYGTIHINAAVTDSKGTKHTKTNEQVIPMGLGIKYHASNKITLNLEYAFNKVNGDYLDGYSDAVTEYDTYSKLSFGVSYTFGNDHNPVLEWHDPRPRPTAPFYRRDTLVVIQEVIKKDTVKLTPDSALIEHITDSIAKTFLTETIYYDFNKWDYPLMYNSFFSDLAMSVANYPDRKITVDSYCDTIGTPEHNKIIVSRRANAIVKAFLGIGIPMSSIEVTLHGEEAATSPIDAENRKSIVSVRLP